MFDLILSQVEDPIAVANGMIAEIQQELAKLVLRRPWSLDRDYWLLKTSPFTHKDSYQYIDDGAVVRLTPHFEGFPRHMVQIEDKEGLRQWLPVLELEQYLLPVDNSALAFAKDMFFGKGHEYNAGWRVKIVAVREIQGEIFLEICPVGTDRNFRVPFAKKDEVLRHVR